MATKVSLGPEVKQAIESKTGIKIDGVITLADLLAIVSIAFKLLKNTDLKPFIAEFLKNLDDHAKSSKTKWDDLVMCPAISIIRRALGI
ncbi:MAG TPA: hypothetical protein VFM18_10155 [Methanosarcina sp.]|nr:hypothetical protein [Methanosarcina sp.]